jgi:S1-C subfamily serine protease
LGVNIQSVNSQLARQFDLAVNEGAYIAGFAENSSAKDTGIKEGDVVVKIDDVTIRTNADLIEQIGRHRPGDKVEVTIDRKGETHTYPVTLKTRSGDEAIVKREKLDGVASLGIEVEEVDQRTLNSLDLKSGVRVKELSNGKIRRYTNLHEGFIITKINDESVSSVEDFNIAMKKIRSGEIVIFSGTYQDDKEEFLYSFRM